MCGERRLGADPSPPLRMTMRGGRLRPPYFPGEMTESRRVVMCEGAAGRRSLPVAQDDNAKFKIDAPRPTTGEESSTNVGDDEKGSSRVQAWVYSVHSGPAYYFKMVSKFSRRDD